MRLNQFGRALGALLAGLFCGHRWAATYQSLGTWSGPQIIPFYNRGKTGVAAAKRHARKSRNRRRHRYGRA